MWNSYWVIDFLIVNNFLVLRIQNIAGNNFFWLRTRR